LLVKSTTIEAAGGRAAALYQTLPAWFTCPCLSRRGGASSRDCVCARMAGKGLFHESSRFRTANGTMGTGLAPTGCRALPVGGRGRPYLNRDGAVSIWKAKEVPAMNMIYNSPSYCVVEFGDVDAESVGGYEIMDKAARRQIYIAGPLALRFRSDVEDLIASEPTIEEVDAYLSQFDALMQQPITLH